MSSIWLHIIKKDRQSQAFSISIFPWPLETVAFDNADGDAVHAAIPVNELIPDPGEVRAIQTHERHQRQRGRRQA